MSGEKQTAGRWRAGRPIFVGAALGLLVAPSAFALAISEAHVASTLGRPLHLEMIVSGNEDEPPRVQLHTGQLGNLKSSAFLSEFEPLGDRQWRLHIRSTQAVWEPALDLTVEVAQGQTQMQRSVTVLLDPPASPTAVAAAEPASIAPLADEAPAAVAALDPAPSIDAAPVPVAAEPPPRAAPLRRSRAHHRPRAAVPTETPAPPATAVAEAVSVPMPRFRFAERLSTESLSLLDAGTPAPDVQVADSDEAIDAPPDDTSDGLSLLRSAEAAPRVLTAETRLRSTPSPHDDIERRVEAARSAGQGAYFIDAPFKVFFALALCAVLLFGQARRLRQQMMEQQLQTI